MKQISTLLINALIGVVVATTWSCKEPDTPQPAAEPTISVELLSTTDPDFAATSAAFQINSTLIESFAYTVQEGENQPEPDPAMLYAEAKEIHQITGSEQKTTIYGLEGDKKYTVHFAFKIEGKTKYISKSLSTSTPKYDRRINIISADRTDFKVHFNVAEGQHYRYLIYDKKDYDFLGGSMSDANMLMYSSYGQGPQTIHYKDGEIFYDPISDSDIPMFVKPGAAFVVLFVECDEDGAFEYEDVDGGSDGEYAEAPMNVGSATKPNTRNYTEKCVDKWDTDFISPYAKLNLWTAPAIQGEGKFAIERKITEQNSYFTITPPESVQKYGVAILKKSQYDHDITASVGVEGAMYIILTAMTEPTSGVQTFKNFDMLEKDTTYMMAIIGLCDDNWETQIIHSEEFKAISSTLPAIDLTVIQEEAEGGSPYFVRYNVKAPNKDCVNAKYLMNYAKEWSLVIDRITTYENYVNKKGVVLTEEEIAKINSAEGLTMNFPTFEDMETRISINSYNADEKIKNFTVAGRSKPEPAKPKVESPLFTSLLGDWNVAYNYKSGSSTKVTQSKFVATIANAPEGVDPAFGPSTKEYKDLFEAFKSYAIQDGVEEAEAEELAIKEIAIQLSRFESANEKFSKKYKDHNRLVLRNFAYASTLGLAYQSPWNLFCSISYSSYDCEQMFYDYGTKIFLEINKVDGKDVVTVETDQKFIPPFSGYSRYIYSVAGLNGKQMAAASFPVEIVDENTIKIKATVDINGVPHSFITSQSNMGSPTLHSTAAEDIVLTRASAPAAAPQYFTTAASSQIATERASFDFKRTRLSQMGKEKAPIEIAVAKEYRSKITPRKELKRK